MGCYLRDYLRFGGRVLVILGQSVFVFAYFIFFKDYFFDFINLCNNCRITFFSGSHAAALDKEYVSTYFLATSKGWIFSGFSYLA